MRRHPELGHCGVLADAQTAGQGRQGNPWESAAGAGLTLSASRPFSPLPPGLVLQRAMLAVMEVLGVPGLGLKWPNDLVAYRAGRLVKLGGILGEVSGRRLILGVGINLASAPDLPQRAIPPASLADLGFEVAPFPHLARAILSRWNDLETFFQPAFLWPEPGMPLVWEGGQGVCLQWEPDGRLKVTTPEGIRRLSTGEVSGLAVKS